MGRTDVHETAAIGYISYLGFTVVSAVMQDVVFSQHSLDHLFQTNLPNELNPKQPQGGRSTSLPCCDQRKLWIKSCTVS